jgi:hypothetical protein
MKMRVALGPLARAGLESRASGDLTAPVRAALVFYVHRAASGRPPVKYPDFLAATEPGGPDADPGIEVEIEVDEKLGTEFARAAAEQGATVAELGGHAVLLYLAEVDLVDTHGADTPRPAQVVSDKGS